MMHLVRSNSKPKLNSKLVFKAIGTSWQIDFYSLLDQALLFKIDRSIKDRIEIFDKTYSRFRSDSLVSTISKKAGEYELPEDSYPLLSFYRQMYEITSGRVTPLIGQALVEAGYDQTYSLRPRSTIKTVPAWPDVMEYEKSRLITKQPVTLDFGAAGKGYLVDIVSRIIETYGIKNFCVDASGDMAYRSSKSNAKGLTEQSIKVGLEHPDDPNLVIGWADLSGNTSLCASAINRRAWAGFNHIIDPASRKSIQNVKATWVITNTTMLADGLATALFFVDIAHLRQYFDFQCVVVYSDNSAEVSPDFNGGLYD
jgi:thiamine biosynthesis lipoprotein